MTILVRSDSAGMRSLVTVHGLWMNGLAMELLRRGLEPHGFSVHTFRYPSVAEPLESNAERLARFAEAVPGDSLHFVGHSLGGVLVRAMLERHAPSRPGRVVCLGSPLAGCGTATRVGRLPGGYRLLGRSICDLVARGGFDAWQAPLPLGSIAGNVPLGFGRLFGRFGEPNDGTVAVAETRLPGAADHIVLPVTHFALLWSRIVLRQILAFLAHGRFDHGTAAG
jgi:pimeloyl-ACP methyl ester carboxylesterase